VRIQIRKGLLATIMMAWTAMAVVAKGLLAMILMTWTTMAVFALNPSAYAASGPVQAIAVLPLSRGSDYSSHDWMRTAFSEVFAAKITGASRLRVLESAVVFEAFRGVQPVAPAAVSPERVREIGQAVDADLVLWGSVTKLGSQVAIHLKLLAVASGRALDDIRVETSYDNLWLGLNRASRKVIERLDRVPGTGQEARLEAQAARDRYALILFGRALNSLYGVGKPRDLAAARATLERALRIDPGNALMYHALGIAFLSGVSKRDRAAQMFFMAIKYWSDFPNARRRLARLAEEDGKLLDAIGHLQNVLLVEPSDLWVHYNLGRLLAEKKRFGPALEEMDLLTRQARSPALQQRALKLQARLRASQGDLDGMARSFEGLLELEPADRMASFGLAAYQLRRGAWDAARDQLASLIQQLPSDPLPHHFVAEIALTEGNAEAAVDSFRQEGYLKSARPGPWSYLGETYRRLGNIDKVVDAEGMTFVRDKNDPVALNNLAVARYHQEDYPTAAGLLRSALKLAPGWSLLHQNQCVVLARMKWRGPALTSCATAVRLNPELSVAQYQYGLLLAGNELFPAARDAFAAAVAADPDLPAAHYNLAGMLERLGEPARAAEALKTYLERSPQAPDRPDVLARIIRLTGE